MQSFFLLCLCLAIRSEGCNNNGVFGGDCIEKEIDCVGDSCATLYLTPKNGETVAVRGNEKNVKHKNIVSAKVVGTGCFQIYKGRNFRSSVFLVSGAGEHELAALGHEWSSVRSHRYSPDCKFPSKAGAEVYVIVAVVVLVLVVALLIGIWARMRKKKKGEPVATEEI